ncbi:fasciclin domain-containing protein [Palleronia salina]|uniref:fasciclin domain-containing protein n=1 Tax=Palleronia salina TaxID=313368 RepID=UPI001114EDDC|nr:fasciclin domain-containing protein [Palleronia salina]
MREMTFFPHSIVPTSDQQSLTHGEMAKRHPPIEIVPYPYFSKFCMFLTGSYSIIRTCNRGLLMSRRKFLETYFVGAASLLFAPNVLRAQMDIGAETVAAIIAEDRDLNFLHYLLAATSMVHSLSQCGQVTVFAPNDAAFENLGSGLITSK